MPSISNVLIFAALSTLLHLTTAACPPLGPVLPAPKAPSKREATEKSIVELTSKLDEITSSTLNYSALSIGVKSIHESKQLFSYHFTPPETSGIGTDNVDENTIYRVGSISKMIPALAALQSADINLDDSVLQYIPELADASSDDGLKAITWEDITVRSLANHLSGLATDMAMDLAVFPIELWQEMSLPEVAQGTGPSCSGLGLTEPCTKDDLINDISRRPPVFLPQSSPVYSNVAYAILGMVIEAATGKEFEEYARSNIFEVAGMKSTSFNGPVDAFSEQGFVPPEEQTWNSTLGVFEAAGGMFSNTVDLIAFAEAIQKYELLSASKTRQWMKPETHTSSLGVSVGSVWEILRSNNLTSDGRVIDIYTKSGDLGLYHGLLGIIPDYDVSIVVLTAGPEVSLDPYARSKFFSAVVESLVPALEDSGRTEAEIYEGSYVEESTNSTLKLSSDSGPGILVEEFNVRGFDVLNHLPLYSVGNMESGLPPSDKLPPVKARMFPTKRTSKSRSNNSTIQTAWRVFFDTKTEEQEKDLAAELFWIDGTCEAWFGADRAAYNFLSLSDFAVVQGAEGKVKAIKNAAFNVTLTKVSGSDDGGDDGIEEDGENDGAGPPDPTSAGTQGKTMEIGGITAFSAILLISIHLL